MKSPECHGTTDRTSSECTCHDHGENESQTSNMFGIDKRNHFERHDCLKPRIQDAETKGQNGANHVNYTQDVSSALILSFISLPLNTFVS